MILPLSSAAVRGRSSAAGVLRLLIDIGVFASAGGASAIVFAANAVDCFWFCWPLLLLLRVVGGDGDGSIMSMPSPLPLNWAYRCFCFISITALSYLLMTRFCGVLLGWERIWPERWTDFRFCRLIEGLLEALGAMDGELLLRAIQRTRFRWNRRKKIWSSSTWGRPFGACLLLTSVAGPYLMPLRSSCCADYKTGLGVAIFNILMVILTIQCVILCRVGGDAFRAKLFMSWLYTVFGKNTLPSLNLDMNQS